MPDENANENAPEEPKPLPLPPLGQFLGIRVETKHGDKINIGGVQITVPPNWQSGTVEAVGPTSDIRTDQRVVFDDTKTVEGVLKGFAMVDKATVILIGNP